MSVDINPLSLTFDIRLHVRYDAYFASSPTALAQMRTLLCYAKLSSRISLSAKAKKAPCWVLVYTRDIRLRRRFFASPLVSKLPDGFRLKCELCFALAERVVRKLNYKSDILCIAKSDIALRAEILFGFASQ